MTKCGDASVDRSRCKCHDQAAVAEFDLLGGKGGSRRSRGDDSPRRTMSYYKGSHCIKKLEVLLLLLLSVSQCFRAVVFAKCLSMFQGGRIC